MIALDVELDSLLDRIRNRALEAPEDQRRQDDDEGHQVSARTPGQAAVRTQGQGRHGTADAVAVRANARPHHRRRHVGCHVGAHGELRHST